MSSPMSDYSRSQDSSEFLEYFKKESIKTDPRLEFHQDIIKDFGESYERAYQLWNTFYAEAYKDQSYYLGNQWSLEEMSYLNNQRRASYTYNKLKRGIDLMSGIQRKNRLATVISPVEDASDYTAELFTDVIQYINQKTGGYELISEAYQQSLITGLCFLSPYVDYREDPVNGDIQYHMDEWNAVILDPFFTKRDLSDCSFVARRKFLSRTDVISLYPEKEDLINSLPWGSRDDKFTYMPFARQWGMQKLLNYTEYWRTRWETKDCLVDMLTGEVQEWKGDRKRLRLITEMDPQIKLIKNPVKQVEMGVIVEGELLSYEKDPMGINDYPFVPFMAVFQPSYDLFEWKVQSWLRVSRDSQTEANKRRSKMVDIIDSQLNSGWIAKTGAVTNNSALFKSGNGQVIFVKPEAQITDVQRLTAPEIPTTLFQLEQENINDMMVQMGLNTEMFGMPENENVETAAILSKMRQNAGMVAMESVVDGLRQSQKILGEKVLKLIQVNYSPEKIEMITKKKVTPEFYSKSFARYNVSIEEGVLTDTQRQSQFVQLVALRNMGVPIPDNLLIQNSSLHNKKELEDFLAAQSQQAAQAQQMQTQLEMEKTAIEANVLNSKAESDRALAAERLNKVSLDAALSAERISRAEEDRTAGVLNLIKAVKELEQIDLSTLKEKVEILRSIESGQKKEESSSSPVEA